MLLLKISLLVALSSVVVVDAWSSLLPTALSGGACTSRNSWGRRCIFASCKPSLQQESLQYEYYYGLSSQTNRRRRRRASNCHHDDMNENDKNHDDGDDVSCTTRRSFISTTSTTTTAAVLAATVAFFAPSLEAAWASDANVAPPAPPPKAPAPAPAAAAPAPKPAPAPAPAPPKAPAPAPVDNNKALAESKAKRQIEKELALEEQELINKAKTLLRKEQLAQKVVDNYQNQATKLKTMVKALSEAKAAAVKLEQRLLEETAGVKKNSGNSNSNLTQELNARLLAAQRDCRAKESELATAQTRLQQARMERLQNEARYKLKIGKDLKLPENDKKEKKKAGEGNNNKKASSFSSSDDTSGGFTSSKDAFKAATGIGLTLAGASWYYNNRRDDDDDDRYDGGGGYREGYYNANDDYTDNRNPRQEFGDGVPRPGPGQMEGWL